MSALIRIGLAQNENYVFGNHKVYFHKSTEPSGYQHECTKDTNVI